MKHNKKNKRMIKKLEKDKGFTIIETLFSLLLISLAVVCLYQMITFAIDAQKKSAIRFNMQQKIESCRSQLVSKSFDNDELEEGSYSTTEIPLKIKWDITNISSTLKLIQLSVTYKQVTKKVYFYKSKYIKNNEPTEVKND